ncbi:glutathione S-transferase domain-containing protein [Tieghemostelium lacteum]|uniref:Glutathione S-transferase domain-containing protein n=1 Tax=Tieghemostelium lacteum TaxID=361077 RepID=A0A152A0W4_TIELA|nr:glutathione S-transferase domain-containing protein [Tieghemostelium lacteum]|eukprot:KYQ99843.1 glutathione S-transferase domain-containing protein [Tieghemostelium lacteum]
MNTIINYFTENRLSSTILVSVVTLVALKKIFGKKEDITKEFQKDIVYVYEFGATTSQGVPSNSPFCAKVLLFLEFANIPYKRVPSRPTGPRSKLPFIYYNGQFVYDSQFILEFLMKEFNVTQLVPQDDALATRDLVIRKFFDDTMTPVTMYPRWYDEKYSPTFINGVIVVPPYLAFIRNYVVKNIRKQLYASGIGRYPAEEVYKMGRDYIDAISNLLGAQQFFLGDTLSLCDLTAFCLLIQFRYSPLAKNPLSDYLATKQNICEYIDRVKHTLCTEEKWNLLLDSRNNLYYRK